MKQCSICGLPGENSDIICKHCGFLFAQPGSTAPDQNGKPAQDNQNVVNQDVQRPYTGYNGPYNDNQNSGNPYPGSGNSGSGNSGYGNSGYTNGGYSNYQTSYPQNPQYQQFPQPVRTNGMSTASMVLGIVGVAFVFCYGIGIIPSILAIIFGFISRSAVMHSNGSQTGSSMSVAGIVMGFAAIAILIFIIIFCVVVFASIPSLVNSFSSNYNYNNGSFYNT